MGFPLKPRSPIIDWKHPLTYGLVFDAPFSEGGGNPDTDILMEIVGTLAASGATWVEDRYGKALDFLAAASAVTYTVSAPVTNLAGGQMSIETLQYQRGTGGGGFGRLIHNGGQSTPNFMLLAGDNSSSDLGFVSGHGGGTSSSDASWAITQNVWSHFVVTYDGTSNSNQAKGYLNAVIQSIEGPGTLPGGSSDNGNGTMTIGNRATDYGRNYNGKIAYVRLWNRLLTYADIQELYENPFRIYRRTKSGIFLPR